MSIQRYLKQTTGVLVVAFAVLTATQTAQAKEYKDLTPEHWAYEAVQRLEEKGFMQREGDYFKADEYVTRSEASIAIANLLTTEYEAVPLQFRDVRKTHAHYQAVEKLTAAGVIQNARYFKGSDNLRRSQMAKMITLASDLEYETAHLISFTDVTKAAWAYDYIGAVTTASIMNGVSLDNFYPERNVTRAQLAAIIDRALYHQEHVDYTYAHDYLNKIVIDTTNESREWAVEVATLTNAFRAQYDLPPLRYDRALEQIAIIKAKDMIYGNYFEHDSPLYGQPWDLATIFDYSFIGYGENIARYFKTPKHTVLGWMNSPGHRKNILSPTYTHIGIGITKDQYDNIYWVQHFASK